MLVEKCSFSTGGNDQIRLQCGLTGQIISNLIIRDCRRGGNSVGSELDVRDNVCVILGM